MQQVLEIFPGAQRALFRRYHIGGCSSCGFQPTETLEQLFAGEYPDYSREVPLFVPRATAYQSSRADSADRERRFSWSQYSRHREYRAAIGVVFAFALLVAKTFLFTR